MKISNTISDLSRTYVENVMGKTHIMKLAYAACQASKHDVSFSQKTTMIFRPD